MSITTMDGVVTGLATGQIIPYYKGTSTTKGAGYYHSLWTISGEPKGASVPASGSGESVNSTTTGAFAFSNPSPGNTLYLGRASLASATSGHFILYDRLVQTSGLSGTATTTQTVNSVALTRNVTGAGCRLFIEFYTATGSSQVNITINYTNQSGTSGRSVTVPFVATPAVGTMINIPLIGGDNGIRSVQDVTLSSSTGTVGNFGIVIVKQLCDFPIAASNDSVYFDAISVGLPIINDDSCLALMFVSSATAHGNIMGQLNFIEG